jgi:small subunit ribosomal protein S16
MAVRLRLRRTGTTNKACYRVVAADRRSPRDGRFIETLGLYDPRHNSENLNMERVEYWLSVGAEPSRTVTSIIRRIRQRETGELVDSPRGSKPMPPEPDPVVVVAPEPVVEAEAPVVEAEAPVVEAEAPEAPEAVEAPAEEAPAEEAAAEAPEAEAEAPAKDGEE